MTCASVEMGGKGGKWPEMEFLDGKLCFTIDDAFICATNTYFFAGSYCSSSYISPKHLNIMIKARGGGGRKNPFQVF